MAHTEANNQKHQWIITDCGSTTSKTIIFSDQNPEHTWHSTTWAVHPTTVEKPFDDVTVGVKKTFTALGLADTTGSFLATSSAGGGLRLCILALTKQISGAALQLAALHAGAIICECITMDDELRIDERIIRIKNSKPDIILVAGGFSNSDNPAISALLLLLREANPHSRFGPDIKIPVIYAGSTLKQSDAQELSEKFTIAIVPSIIPNKNTKNLTLTEEKIHDCFLYSVMQHAPGYKKLLEMTAADILPTPLAVTKVLENFAAQHQQSMICIDMGGATTDVFSADRNGAVYRSVSSNIGMSYSAVYILKSAGVQELLKFLPPTFSADEVTTSIYNKMIRPTTHPQDDRELQIEHALARVGISLALRAHYESRKAESSSQDSAATGIGSIFVQNNQDVRVPIDTIIASGGVFSHCPKPELIPWILADGMNLVGITDIMLDRIFMLPHLGVLSTVNSAASLSLLKSDCLEKIGNLVVLKRFKGNSAIRSDEIKIIINQDASIELPFPLLAEYVHPVTVESIEIQSKVYLLQNDGTRAKNILFKSSFVSSKKVFIKR